MGIALSVMGSTLEAEAQKAKHNRLTKKEKEAGWKLLFNGKNLNKWRNFKKETLSDGWQIKDGAFVRASGGAGDIVTKRQYDAFELQLDYKISKGGNSGLMFHVKENANAPWHTGPEIQIQDNWTDTILKKQVGSISSTVRIPMPPSPPVSGTLCVS